MTTVTRSEFDDLSGKVNGLSAKIDQVLEIVLDIQQNQIAPIYRQFSGFRDETRQRFDRMDERFDQLDTKVDRVATEVTELSGSVDSLTEAHGQLRAAVDRHDEHSK